MNKVDPHLVINVYLKYRQDPLQNVTEILFLFYEFFIRHFVKKLLKAFSRNIRPIKTKNSNYRSLFCFQFTRTVLKSTSPLIRSVECIKSILMVWANLKCSVIRKQPVEVGQCFRRGEMALLISSALGIITKEGFGNLNGEFWLGLDKIHRQTVTGGYKLRIDLEDIHGKTAFAEYSSFSVTSERAKYQLSLGSYSG